ncbi:MAG TPA: response regulator transcription factor [Bdellovibrionota bacterium]|jgi:DNA-binding response OmpR family regulator
MKRLLLVEDDPTLGVTLKERLAGEGYDVSWASTAAAARSSLNERADWDLVLFDVGLPDGSGFELASEWKSKLPFLFVTALSDAEHRLRGFELGAEEYIPKPFHLRELLMRVRHVLENHARVRPTLDVGGAEIDFSALTVKTSDGELHRPATKDFQLLSLLVERAPRVLSRDEILDGIWGKGHLGNTRTVDNAIVRLRGLFDESPIRSVRGVGYQWAPGSAE